MKLAIVNYNKAIMSKKEYIEELKTGKLPLIEGFQELFDILNLYNKLEKENDWGWIFHEKISEGNEYEIQGLLSEIGRTANSINANNSFAISNYNRNYEYFKTKIDDLTTKLKIQIEKDVKENESQVSNGRMNDISTGIFSVEEADQRAMFNRLIKPYKSIETKQMIMTLNDLYDQYFAYYYLKFEYISSLPLKIFPNKSNWNYWKEKIEAINKLPLGDKIKDKDVKTIMDAANYYKHQTQSLTLPTIEFMDKLIRQISDKINANTCFDIYKQNVKRLYYEIDNIMNPLGLTGFE